MSPSPSTATTEKSPTFNYIRTVTTYSSNYLPHGGEGVLYVCARGMTALLLSPAISGQADSRDLGRSTAVEIVSLERYRPTQNKSNKINFSLIVRIKKSEDSFFQKSLPLRQTVGLPIYAF